MSHGRSTRGARLGDELAVQIPKICFFLASNSSSLRIPWSLSWASYDGSHSSPW
jgi:hypothetical protein